MYIESCVALDDGLADQLNAFLVMDDHKFFF